MSGTSKESGRLPFASLGTRSGTILGRYELVRRIGTGGMAEVYEAVHRGLKKTVAVKVLLPETAENPELRARFLREGEAASRIQHPHVVDVTDVAEEDGVAFLVMEFLEGENLSQLLNQSPEQRLSLTRTLDILLPIAAALDEAHAQGVVHRDLKPENVFIARTSNGKVVPKILDFGVSKLAGNGIPSTTAVSAVLGTPHYMSPEQARGDADIDGRADQYSFALMIYECVTGTLPFRSDNVVALLHEVARGVGLAPSQMLPSLPPELDIILLKALGPDPSLRYPSVGALAEQLLAFASPRGRETFHLLHEKEPRGHNAPSIPPPPSEITGSFAPTVPRDARSGASGARVPTPTVSQRPSNKPTPRATTPIEAEPKRSSAPVLAIVVLLLLAGGGAAGYGFLRTGEADGDPANGATAVPAEGEAATGEAATGAAATGERAGEGATGEGATGEGATGAGATGEGPTGATGASAAGEGGTPPTPPLQVTIVASPASAEIEIDGVVVGTGQCSELIEQRGSEHLLVVRAPGYFEHRTTFTDEAPPLRVELTAIDPSGDPTSAPSGTGRRPGGRGDHVTTPPGGSSEREPPEREEDIRSTR